MNVFLCFVALEKVSYKIKIRLTKQQKNSKFSEENIMNRPRKYKKHFDSSHSILYNAYPETYTSSIGVPGEFVEKINRNVNLKDGTQGEVDSAYILIPMIKS